MVHVGLVLEFTVVAAMVAKTVPRFDADERCLLLVGAPEGDDGTTVVEGHGRGAIGIQQGGLRGLTLVELHAIIGEGARFVVSVISVPFTLYKLLEVNVNLGS